MVEKIKKGLYYAKKEIEVARFEDIMGLLIRECGLEKISLARCCLHLREDSSLMTMIIVIINKYVYPIHRHDWKDESYTILEGYCRFKEYRADGSLISEVKLRRGDTIMNNSQNYHSIEPESNILGYVENTTGPFNGRRPEFLRGQHQN